MRVHFDPTLPMPRMEVDSRPEVARSTWSRCPDGMSNGVDGKLWFMKSSSHSGETPDDVWDDDFHLTVGVPPSCPSV